MVAAAGLMLAFGIAGPGTAGEAVTPIDQLQRGMPGTVQGTVVRFTDEDTFRLQDGTGTVSIYIGWRNRVALRPGEKIIVEGVVDDDLLSAIRPELYAHRITREDGSAIELRY
jgi:uncharacterized protein YdeI (BOF family)